MYSSVRLIGTASTEKESRQYSLSSFLLGPNYSTSNLFKDTLAESHGTNRGQLAVGCKQLSYHIRPHWSIRMEQLTNIQTFSNDGDCVCLAFTHKDLPNLEIKLPIHLTNNFSIYPLQDISFGKTQNILQLGNYFFQGLHNYYSNAPSSYDDNLYTAYMSSPFTQLELQGKDNHSISNDGKIDLANEQRSNKNIYTMRITASTSLDGNMLIFRIYGFSESREPNQISLPEKDFQRYYELILLKNNNDILFAEARHNTFSGNSIWHYDLVEIYSRPSRILLTPLTAIDCYHFEGTFYETNGGPSARHADLNDYRGGFHYLSQLDNDEYLTTAPVLYNNYYHIQSNDQMYALQKDFLQGYKIKKEKIQLTTNRDFNNNFNLGEKCIQMKSNQFPFSHTEDTLLSFSFEAQMPQNFDEYIGSTPHLIKRYLALSPNYIIPVSLAPSWNLRSQYHGTENADFSPFL